MICGLIQFYPLLAIPIILIYNPPDYTLARGYVYLIIGYTLAKVFEALETFQCMSLRVLLVGIKTFGRRSWSLFAFRLLYQERGFANIIC